MSQAEHRSMMNLSAENAIRAEIAAADLSMAGEHDETYLCSW